MRYSFLTTKSWRIDAEAKNPRQGYKLAQIELDKVYTEWGSFVAAERFGKLSGTYFKYNEDGLHAVDGEYFQI